MVDHPFLIRNKIFKESEMGGGGRGSNPLSKAAGGGN